MAGGPGGSGGGVETSSLLWAIVMSAFAGSCIILILSLGNASPTIIIIF